MADPSHRLLWDLGFLMWGALMAAVGWTLLASRRPQ
jgi:uncharacterized membrane protein